MHVEPEPRLSHGPRRAANQQLTFMCWPLSLEPRVTRRDTERVRDTTRGVDCGVG